MMYVTAARSLQLDPYQGSRFGSSGVQRSRIDSHNYWVLRCVHHNNHQKGGLSSIWMQCSYDFVYVWRRGVLTPHFFFPRESQCTNIRGYSSERTGTHFARIPSLGGANTDGARTAADVQHVHVFAKLEVLYYRDYECERKTDKL